MLIRKRLSFFGIAAGAAMVAGALGLLPLVRDIELSTYDWRVRASARAATPAPTIVMVEIGDDSIRRMESLVGRWPWPRLVHATLIDFLAAGGAKVIAYDILFAERDQRRFMVGETEWTGEESDAALVEATRKAGMVVHAAAAASEELVDRTRALATDLSAPGLNQPFRTDSCVEQRPQLTPPFPALASAARGIGHTLFVLDADGPMRRTPPMIRVGERAIPSLPLATMTLARGLGAGEVGIEAGRLALGDSRSPLVVERVADYQQHDLVACRALVPFRGPTQDASGQASFTSYSFYDLFYSQQQILEGQKPQVDPVVFKDRLVLVGTTAQGLHDVFNTPFAEGRMSGLEIHANVVDGMLAGRSMAPAPPRVGVVLTLGLALLIAGVGFGAAAWVTGTAAAVTVALLAWFSVVRFGSGVWIPVTVPAIAVVLAFVGDLAWKYVVEGREKRQIKKLFSRYVSRDVYDQLVADPSLAALGGVRRNMTVLFSDVRGFTAMSEKGSPEAVVGLLNEYFSRMVAVVFDHGGTIDKFVGDMVMALFGAPLPDDDHADHAVQTALAMAAALAELNAGWQAQGRPTLDIGIGINTGDMVAGNIGSDTIMSYTVIGDAVNLGARLESLNKDYGTRIIISDDTRVRLKGQYDIFPLGDVVAKGKSKPVAIFEVKAP